MGPKWAAMPILARIFRARHLDGVPCSAGVGGDFGEAQLRGAAGVLVRQFVDVAEVFSSTWPPGLPGKTWRTAVVGPGIVVGNSLGRSLERSALPLTVFAVSPFGCRRLSGSDRCPIEDPPQAP